KTRYRTVSATRKNHDVPVPHCREKGKWAQNQGGSLDMIILSPHKIGRRVIALILATAAVIPLTGCDPTDPKKPFNFPGTIWICVEENACIAVIKQDNFGYSYGEIQTDAGVIPITMIYDIAN